MPADANATATTTTAPAQTAATPAPGPGSGDALGAERRAALDAHVAAARRAADEFRTFDQDRVDGIVAAMVRAGLREAIPLAQAAVAETGFGVFEDKVIKNFVATEFLFDYLRDKKTVGVIDEDPENDIAYVAEPIGVVMAIIPVTNPTSTVLFKAIVAAKTRNAIIFRPHPLATRSAQAVVDLLVAAGEKAGLPAGAITVLPDPEHEITHYLFAHPGVDFIWTTGGPRIVELTNASGKPSVSVGPGNAPCYVHRSADIDGAVVDILISKTFDASVICPAEQTLIIDEPVYDAMLSEFSRLGAYVMTPDETERLAAFAFTPNCTVNLAAVGRPAATLARQAGFTVAEDTKVLLAPLPSDLDALAEHPLVHEKLMPVLSVVRSPSVEHGVAAAELVTEHGGLGHTSSVYATDQAVIDAFAARVRTGRILVNAPTAVGALGGVYNALTPTFSLGCGTWGGSSTTENVNYRNLLNIKTVARRKSPPQWFRLPSDTYFNVGALENLRTVEASRVLVITDAVLARTGTVDTVRAHLVGEPYVRIFSDIPPEPDWPVIEAGLRMAADVDPDVIVAVGGGSVLDAAKLIRLFHEHHELNLDELTVPFLDPRKRVARYPSDNHRVTLVALPTTAGTGSEVSPGAVVTVDGRKATLVDYSMVPDMAIVDPVLTLSLPPRSTADTGFDALTHALEAAVSIFSSPYTEAFCVQAARMIFENLPAAVADGSNVAARAAMANAATMAGYAFSNAFLGVNHAMAHAIGSRFHIPHGRANAILLPHVLRYNSQIPSKFMPAPGYTTYVAPQKYAQMGRILFGGHGEQEQRRRLFDAVDRLADEVGMPRSMKDAGVLESDFLAALPEVTMAAYSDVTMRTNPRMPLLSEIEQMLRDAF
jgi:acetaldehyde dehydrogenase/alcohol dehydrogenase